MPSFGPTWTQKSAQSKHGMTCGPLNKSSVRFVESCRVVQLL